jgi:Scaffold protein Nfu/NifU N terminal
MDVRFQATPNPNAGKFIVGQPMVEGNASKSYYSAEQAATNAVAAALFELEGVASVFMVEDFVTVTKRPQTQWSILAPNVIVAIEAAMS